MLKALLAKAALRHVFPGAVVGLGSGTTAREFIRALGSLDMQFTAVATSVDSEIAAFEAGLGDRLRPLWAVDRIDVAVDGADEVSPEKVLIKGRGGALLREKLVDYMASTFVVLVEAHKLVPAVPARSPVPVEVVPWAWRQVARAIEARLGGEARLRVDGSGRLGPVVTDNGNYILDWRPPGPVGPSTEEALKLIPGVVESGVFSRRRDAVVYVAREDGTVEQL